MKINKYENFSKKELIEEITKLKKRKKFGLVWEDKKEKVIEDCKINFPILDEIKKKEIIKDQKLNHNIIIEGDNYHSLSVLNYTHSEKVDLIYIDPPYNTGKSKEFKFNDKWVDVNDGYRHSKWLSFMNKRLVLAKNLLKKTGVIILSIDNNEFYNLKNLCDHIFKENNFVGSLIWRKKEGGGQTDDYFVTEHEYVLIYQKSNLFKWKDETILEDEKKFTKEDKFGNFVTVNLAKWGAGSRKEDRPTMHYPIKSPDGKRIFPIAPDGNDGRWRVGKKRMDYLNDNNLIHWSKNSENDWTAKEKIYFDANKKIKIKERSILYDVVGGTAEGTNELTEIFGKKDIFENPKPTSLIEFFLKHTTEPNSIILDFFAGSGSTGHAVLKYNSLDNGQRKFILCTNNEDNICDKVCYPRISKIINGYKSKKRNYKSLISNLKYFKTSFIPFSDNDKNKLLLTQRVTEMLCIKENTFEEVTNNNKYKIFKHNKNFTIIVYDQLMIDEVKKVIKKTIGNIKIYIFSLGNDTFDEEFDNYENVSVEPVPQPIISTYKRLFNHQDDT